jgi:hypothetical protein
MKSRLLLCFLLLACGDASPGRTGDGGVDGGACVPQSSCKPFPNRSDCLEYNISKSESEQACVNSGGTSSGAPCSRIGAVGGCRKEQPTAPTCIVAWYYSADNATPESTRQICVSGGTTFVSP